MDGWPRRSTSSTRARRSESRAFLRERAWQPARLTAWEELVERAEGGAVTRGSMFGSQGLWTGRKFFVWWHDQLVLKLPPGRLRELVAGGTAHPFEPMEGRAINGWVVVAASADWPPLVEEARAFVAAQSG